MSAKLVLAWVAGSITTGVVAVGSVWPFYNAWGIRDEPAFQLARAWVLESPSVAEVAGPNHQLDSDIFPTGGVDGGFARFEYKVRGDRQKAKIGVLLEERDGAWTVTRAAWKNEDVWEDLELR